MNLYELICIKTKFLEQKDTTQIQPNQNPQWGVSRLYRMRLYKFTNLSKVGFIV